MKNSDLILYISIWAIQMIPVTLIAYGASAWLHKDGRKVLLAGAVLGLLGAILAVCLLPAGEKRAAKKQGPKPRRVLETGIR